MRTAEEKKFYIIINYLFFKIFKVYVISVVFKKYKVVAHNSSAIVINNLRKRIIYRLLYKYGISRLCKCFNRHCKCKHYTRCLNNPSFFHIPVMMSFHPSCNSLKIFFSCFAVAENTVFYPFNNRIFHIR